MLNYYHRAFIFVLDHHPDIQEAIEEKLHRFITDPSSRTKISQDQLEIILALSIVSHKVKFNQLIKPYLEELHDRNVQLIAKKMAAFENLDESKTSPDYFKEIYSHCTEGFNLLMYFAYFNRYVIMKETDDRHLDSLIDEYDKRYSRLYYKIEDNMQGAIKKIKTIDTYQKFYKYMKMS